MTPTSVSVPSSPFNVSVDRQNLSNDQRRVFEEKGSSEDSTDFGVLRDRFIGCNEVVRRREGAGLGAKTRILMKSDENVRANLIFGDRENGARIRGTDDLLNNYTKKLYQMFARSFTCFYIFSCLFWI